MNANMPIRSMSGIEARRSLVAQLTDLRTMKYLLVGTGMHMDDDELVKATNDYIVAESNIELTMQHIREITPGMATI